MLKHLESIVLFVHDIDAAAQWYAGIFKVDVRHENSQYAYIRVQGLVLGFHPIDQKSPGGIGGATAYWEVANLSAAIHFLQSRGAVLHRGPIQTDLGAKAAMLRDPFGCTIGLNESAS